MGDEERCGMGDDLVAAGTASVNGDAGNFPLPVAASAVFVLRLGLAPGGDG